mmetsp:Transcript_24202/g.45052  ORF Transcript_24202/g.45052 Transcript_24202/m.45052 type:complete len:245 (+) Transcript_24202:1679-2413(+)
MPHQHALDLDRADVFAARDDDILGPVRDLNIAVGMLHRDVARVKIAALKCLGGGIGVLEIPFHDRVAAHHDLALRGPVHRHLAHVTVHDRDVFHHRKGDALTCLDRGLAILRQPVPVGPAPDAFGHVAICFGQPVDLGDVEPQGLDLAQGGRGRGRPCGKHFDHVIKGAAVGRVRIDQHVQHDRCAAEMSDTLIRDGIIDRLRGNIAATHQRAAQQRHHPSVVPAIAVKQRHDGHKNRIQLHPP